MKERVLQILSDIRPDINFASVNSLIDVGHLDSFDIVSIISELNDEYNITIRVTELKPENFNTVDAMIDLVIRLQAK